jgi:aminoglycoside phosphotransferase (APT) family kinase protein
MRSGHQLDTRVLAEYLDKTLNIKANRLQIREFGHGQSNPTYYVGTDGGERLVLRKKPPGKLLKGAHMVEREYIIKKLLRRMSYLLRGDMHGISYHE